MRKPPKYRRHANGQAFVQYRYRRSVNNHTNRIKRFFKWCCREEHLPKELYNGLACVEGLRAGRSQARESKPVEPVPLAWLVAVLPELPAAVAAMCQIQYLCGMRPGEVVVMRAADINMAGDIWLYRPGDHKTAHHGHTLLKAIPRRAQELIKPAVQRADPWL